MAEVLSQVSASTVVRGTVAAAALTVGTTYTLSVARHDARFLPMISDTFVKAPEVIVGMCDARPLKPFALKNPEA
jgi:hypothetical protein